MKIEVKSSTMVKPLVATPITTLWLSNMDLIMALNHHTRVPFFYSSTAAANFFDSSVLKAALSRALVEFYPLAGRLMKNESNDRTEINCNGEGALFVEAESDGTLHDLGDFAPRPELSLTPPVDYSKGISTYPLLLVQVTRFKCGGVCLGIGMHHEIGDGFSRTQFFNTWSGISRGVDVAVAPPYMDRRLLCARSPPQPQFTHAEYQLPPTSKTTPQHNSKISSETIFSVLKITRDQLNALKANSHSQDEQTNKVTYTTFEVLAGHVWRAVTKARALPKDEQTTLYIPVSGRSRIQPPLPRGYLGNAVFKATCVALCGELESKPLKFAAHKVHEAIARMDNEYLRSAIDYLEVQGGIDPRVHGTNPSKCPNLMINNWAGFRGYDLDFGWGKPVYMGFCGYLPEGTTVVIPGPNDDGSLWYAILLPKEQMQVFEKLFYQI